MTGYSAEPSIWRSGSISFVCLVSGDTLFELPQKWVVADSVAAQKNGFWLEPLRDYAVVPPGNILRLSVPLVKGDSLFVTYRYAPFSLARSFAKRSLTELRRIEQPDDSTEAISIEATDETSVPSWTSLRRSGSLIRSVQIGTNQDLAFESALSLQVEGKVGTSVDVVAALSDQNLPIQPEGTSESIRELDQVFVTAKSPHFEATIGDYEFKLEGKKYDGYARKLSGLTLGAKTEEVGAVIAAAIGRGEFNTNRFNGEESVQGPYALIGRNGETNIVVLAGTETVWLDGLALRRGENNDYIIDYASGQVTFTSRKLITADSRIVVEFEYANEDFERQYWAARTSIEAPRIRAGAFITYLAERDDRARPLGFTIEENDKEKLAGAGDSIGYAVTETADSIGPNAGDYVRRDTLINETPFSMFVYVMPSAEGEPQGEWQVFFGDFGVGQGDYSATADELGRTYFEFVGIGEGRYRPARRIPLPTLHELVVMRVGRIAGTGLHSNVEVAMSSIDRNTYSPNDDADNGGMASSAEIGYSQPEFELAGVTLRNVSVSLDGSVRGRTFADISRSDAIEFDRDWGGATARQSSEVIGQTAIGFAPLKSVRLFGSAGVLDREETFSSARINISGTFQPTTASMLRGEQTTINSRDSLDNRETDWVRQRIEGRTKWNRLTPRFTYSREQQFRDARTTVDGFRFSDLAIGSAIDLPFDFQIEAESGVRRDDSRSTDKEFRRVSDAASVSGEIRWLPMDLGRSSMRWSHRDKQFEDEDSASVVSDAGRFELLLTPRNRVIELNVQYDALKSRTEKQLQLFLPVAEGTGSYSLVDGVYVPDDQGNFELVSRNTGTYEPSSEIKTSGTLWFRPDESNESAGLLWRKLSFETEASLEEQTRQPITLGLLLLDRGKLRGDQTIDGRFSIKQDIHFNRLSRKFSFRLRGLNSAAQVSRYENGTQQSIRREGSLRARYKLSKRLRCESELSADLDRALYDGLSVESSDVKRQSFLQDVVWTVAENWESGIRVRATESADERSLTQASIRAVSPRISYTRFRQGRADTEFEWIRVSSNRVRLPQSLAEGSNRGDNFRWSMRVTLALSNNFSSSLNYTGRLDAGEETVNVGRVEVRATF